MLAPQASATDYTFVASNGTTCELDIGHDGTPEADGEWTIGWSSGVTCDGEMWGVTVLTDLWYFRPDGVPVTYSGASAFCSKPDPWAHRPCGSWTVRSDGLVSNLPGGRFQHHTSVGLDLPEAAPGAVQPVWVVTAPGCLPGGRETGCEIVEEFRRR